MVIYNMINVSIKVARYNRVPFRVGWVALLLKVLYVIFIYILYCSITKVVRNAAVLKFWPVSIS